MLLKPQKLELYYEFGQQHPTDARVVVKDAFNQVFEISLDLICFREWTKDLPDVYYDENSRGGYYVNKLRTAFTIAAKKSYDQDHTLGAGSEPYKKAQKEMEKQIEKTTRRYEAGATAGNAPAGTATAGTASTGTERQ